MPYLEDLLESQRVPPEVEIAVRARRAEIESILRPLSPSPRIYYGGSFAKHTAIAASFDLDIVAYWAAATAAHARDLYAQVESRLRAAGHAVLRHNVALRIQYTMGWHVDIVPGRALDDTYEYADLWSAERNATRQTSLKRHIALARAADRDVVRLLKLWRARNVVPIGSFILELAAARAAAPALPLEARFLRVLDLLAGFESIRLIDPANSNNIVTDDIDPTRKRRVAELAQRAGAEPALNRIVW